MKSRYSALAVAGALLLAACAEPTSTLPTLTRAGGMSHLEATQYVLISRDNTLPVDLAASVAAAGGQVDRTQDFIALVSSADPSFAARAASISGLEAVVADQVIEMAPQRVAAQGIELEESALTPPVGSTETFRKLQWYVDAVSAPAAWNAGYRGAGARVAVLDGGIYNSHIDLVGRVDAARSTSFVPGFAYNQDVGTLWHGTHVAGIIAAEDNTIGTVGIAPRATLVGVKVLHNGTGNFGWLIAGLLYASDPAGANANVVNMSLGALGMNHPTANRDLVKALDRATKVAVMRGVTVVAAAGNDGVDLDDPKNQNLPKKLISIPAENLGVIAVSALGPVGFAYGATNFDRPASYTNFGKTAISFGAPGGDFVYPTNELCAMPRNPSGSVVTNCWVFDMVMSTVRGTGTSISDYNWTAGTSMASPVAAGVAALIIGKYGPLPPSQVQAILRQSSDDLGKPGKDIFYGHGRVNAARAVGAQ